jgi:signal transduction histidine kinase/ligand-binding sensor domain-containing protein
VGTSLFKLSLILVLVGLCRPPLFAQTKSEANLQVGHDFWGFKDNAPQGTAALAQTSDGFLWLGSPTGLYRFDGTRFELFHSPFGDQLSSRNIAALFAPPSGGLWIGYIFGGFSFLQDGRVTNYGLGSAVPTGSVHNFAQNADGVLWAATSSGLWKFDHSHWQHIGSESNVPAGSIREARFDTDGTLWTLTGAAGDESHAAKLFYLRPGSSHFRRAEADLHGVGYFTLDADGRVVTSPESRELYDKTNGDSADSPGAYPVLYRGDSPSAIVDQNNSVWIAGGPTVLRVTPSEGLANALSTVPPSNSETYNVNPNQAAKLVDREGNIWFGDPIGVHRFFYSPLIRQELPTDKGSYFTVATDDQGAVWITAGGDKTELFRVFANGQVESRNSLSVDLGFTYRSPDKTVWFGGSDGLSRLVDGSLVRVELPKEMADQAIYLQTITQDHRGGMWVSFGRHGLYRLADGVWTSYGGREDLPKTGVVIEFTDSLDRVWFGYTKSELAVLDGDHVQVFGPKDGIRVGNITAIYGRGSEIWIGGEFGLQQFDHGRFHDIQATDGELLSGIAGIIETANGDLWLHGLGGIFHLRPSEISEALKNPAYQVKGDHFGTREGLPGLAFQLRPLNTAVEGTDGRLWFATSGGVVWLDPASSKKNLPPPPSTIQSIAADDKSYPLGSELRFPAHTSSVQIGYAAISLADPTAVRFRYKLQETDQNWHEAASASPVSYRNLAPGSYHFSVMATDTNGVWSDKVATAEFGILPAFYQTRWFLALCIAAAFGALYLPYLLHLRRVAERFQARMDERTRIARDLHDTLLQSFQGHLLLLASVSKGLPKSPANDETKNRLNSVIDQAAQAVTEGRDAVQGLRSSTMRSGDLGSALKTLGEELAAADGNPSTTAFHVEVEGTPRELKPAVREEMYRVAGEALRNAFHHAEARQVEVSVRYAEQQLTVRIRDDGKGISSEVLEAKGRAGHWGLQGMRERAHTLGGRLELRSRAGSGTEVELRIPAASAYQSSAARARWFWFRRTTGTDP